MARRARLSLLAAALVFPLWSAGNADLAQVQIVYLLPMGNGFDQYLANRIIGEQVFQVVADHTKADALLTDQIGATFEARYAELYPPPPEPTDESEKDEEKEAEQGLIPNAGPPPMSTFTRSRGNLFLVDVRTRRVLWSVYERPKSSAPDELDKTSRKIVSRLKKAVHAT
jgi:hypothetical protein